MNTTPEKTLLAFADHGKVNGSMPIQGGDAEKMLAAFAQAGVDDAVLARRLQREGINSLTKPWRNLMELIASKSDSHAKTSCCGVWS